MKRYLYLHWFIYPLFLLCCAKQTSPTGGPKDTIPPTLIKSIPSNGSINFQGNEINLVFSEGVMLKNQKEQILITPDVGKDYEIVANKKNVIIKLKEKLKDSTTYTINFRDAIVDINEQNTARNLKLAFSTGAYIDSLSISGKTTDLLQAKDLKDITVALYQSDTFDIFKHHAIYISKSDLKAKFEIENLKPGNYYIYAIDDKNRNLLADSKSEPYAFLKDTIVLKSNTKNVTLPLIKLDARKLKVTSARPYNTFFNIKTTKNLIHYQLKAEGFTLFTSFAEEKSTIKIYNTLGENDSTAVKFSCTDSIGNKLDTLLFIKFNKQNPKPEKFSSTPANLRILLDKGTITGNVKFNKPVIKINFDSIIYKIDSLKNIIITSDDVSLDTANSTLLIKKKIDKTLLIKAVEPTTKLKEKDQKNAIPKDKTTKPKKIIENEFLFGKGSFISVENDSSKQYLETVKPTKQDETGIIFINIETNEPDFIAELLNKKFEIVDSKINQKKIAFEDLPPGDYMLRLVIDKDKNKIWTPGNFYLKQEPEEIKYYSNEKESTIINLRANFEIGPLLIKY